MVIIYTRFCQQFHWLSVWFVILCHTINEHVEIISLKTNKCRISINLCVLLLNVFLNKLSQKRHVFMKKWFPKGPCYVVSILFPIPLFCTMDRTMEEINTTVLWCILSGPTVNEWTCTSATKCIVKLYRLSAWGRSALSGILDHIAKFRTNTTLY